MALHEPVQAAIDALIASGGETGLQVAVMHEGHSSTTSARAGRRSRHAIRSVRPVPATM
jgi:hypothetical protein